MNFDSKIKGRGIVTIAAGESYKVTVTGGRKMVVVTSLAALSTEIKLFICDGEQSSEAIGCPPQLPIAVETDSEFFLKNTNTSSVTAVIGEVLFLSTMQASGRGLNSAAGAGNSSGGSSVGGDYQPPTYQGGRPNRYQIP
jgi:hypothetical protein